MGEIVDLTIAGTDLKVLTRAANNAKASTVVDGFKLTSEQVALMSILKQSTINGRSNIKRTEFQGVPIIEVTE